jgi:hypothetical protein
LFVVVLELIKELPLAELLVVLVQDFNVVWGQQEEPVGNRPHLATQRISKTGTEVYHSLRKLPLNVSKVHDHDLLALETVSQILDIFVALRVHDAHPPRGTEEVLESHTVGRGGLVMLRVPEPPRQAPER